jgi:hypothetical protein
MRVLAISLVFVVLNGLGFVYRAAVHKREAASAATTAPLSVEPGDKAGPAQVAPHADAPASVTSTPPVSAPAMTQPDATDKSDKQAVTPPSAAVPMTATATRPESSVPAVPVVRPSDIARPAASSAGSSRKPAPSRQAVARPRVTPSQPDTPPTAKTDSTPHNEDVLLKMEANPYKRGE